MDKGGTMQSPEAEHFSLNYQCVPRGQEHNRCSINASQGIDGWVDGWMHGWTDRQTEMDGQTDGWTASGVFVTIVLTAN